MVLGLIRNWSMALAVQFYERRYVELQGKTGLNCR
jgi:hypothetical protein